MSFSKLSDNSTFLLMVVSSFCSKCYYNRKLLKEVLPNEIKVVEINIANDEYQNILETLRPKTVPTLYIIDKNRPDLIYSGILNSNIIHSIIQYYNKLVK